MTILLGSPIANIRMATSDLLYTSFLTYGDVTLKDENKQEELMNILSNCDWGDKKDDLRQNQNKIRQLLMLKPILSIPITNN